MGIFGKVVSFFRGGATMNRRPQVPRPATLPAGKAANNATDYFADTKNWVNVESSNVDSISYFNGLILGQQNVLAVRFQSGAVYHYYGVSLSLYSDFLTASSKGRFVHERLKRTNVPYRRIA